MQKKRNKKKMIFKKPFNYFKYNYFIISFHLENIFIKIIEPNKPAKKTTM